MSARHAPALCLVLAAAFVPTAIHSYAGLRIDDGLRTAAIPAQIAGFAGTPTRRSATWGKRRFDAHDWIERRYLGAGADVVLTVVRSYDLKALYHHPELAVAYGTPFRPAEAVRLRQDPTVPVHLLRPASGGSTTGMYVLHYDRRFVERPIWFQLRTAGELLVRGRQAMTLFFVTQAGAADATQPDALAAARVLFAAIGEFLDADVPAPAQSAAAASSGR